MGSNLVTRQGKFWWSFDVKCAQQLYQSYQTSDYWDLLNSPPAGVTINLVRAAESDRHALPMPRLTTHCPMAKLNSKSVQWHAAGCRFGKSCPVSGPPAPITALCRNSVMGNWSCIENLSM